MPRLYPDGTPVRTYAHETVLRLPTPDALSDRAALADFGRRAAQVFIELDDVPVERRNEVAAARIREVLAEVCAGRGARTEAAAQV